MQELVSQRTGFISERDNKVRISLIKKLKKHLEYMNTLSYTSKEKDLIDKMLNKLTNLENKYNI